MTNEFNGFSLFYDVEDRTLQAYNRYCVGKVIKDTIGEEALCSYFENFDVAELATVGMVVAQISLEGEPTFKRNIYKGDWDEV